MTTAYGNGVPDEEKLAAFLALAAQHGFAVPQEPGDPRALNALLGRLQGHAQQRALNQLLLRAMMQAIYQPENIGHYGLAAEHYLHFTSPIRRYPDLVVHRILKGILAKKLKEKDIERLSATLPAIALHTSGRERVAMEAEREVVLLKKIQFMLDRVGEEFDGFITGVTPHGFFVELVELFVEGMVAVATLPSDFYRYVEQQHALMGEHGRRVFRIGDKVRVRVALVSTERKQIDFVLAETAVQEPRDSRGKPEEYPRIPVKGKRPKSGAKQEGFRKGAGRRGKGR